MEDFIRDNLRLITWEAVSQGALRTVLNRSGRPVHMQFWRRGMCSQARVLVEGYSDPRGTDILVNGFNAFVSLGRCEKLG